MTFRLDWNWVPVVRAAFAACVTLLVLFFALSQSRIEGVGVAVVLFTVGAVAGVASGRLRDAGVSVGTITVLWSAIAAVSSPGSEFTPLFGLLIATITIGPGHFAGAMAVRVARLLEPRVRLAFPDDRRIAASALAGALLFVSGLLYAGLLSTAWSQDAPPLSPPRPVDTGIAAQRFGLDRLPSRIADLPLSRVIGWDHGGMIAYWESSTGYVEVSIARGEAPFDALGLMDKGKFLGLQEGPDHIQIRASSSELLRQAADALRPGSLDSLE